jgi:PRTRC genetic system ThiF family protein
MSKVHLLHPEVARSTHQITVCVIGVGGTGSHVLTNLGMINASLKALNRQPLHVVAIDPDVVTETNIGRQIFSPSDIGRYKAEVLVTRLNRYYGTAWEYIAGRFEHGPYPCNFTISCVDSVQVRRIISRMRDYVPGSFCQPERLYYYWIDIGNNQRSGQIIMGTRNHNWNQPEREDPDEVRYLPDFTKEFRYVRSKPNQPSCSMAEALFKQDLFINKIMATYATQMMWSLLKDFYITYRGLFVNLETMRSSPIPL